MGKPKPPQRSRVIRGLEWIGDRIPYPVDEARGDTYPVTWSDDGELYTSAGDPRWCTRDVYRARIPVEGMPNGVRVVELDPAMQGLDVEKIEGVPPNYKLSVLHAMPNFTGGGGYGVKPTGMISVAGVLYLAVQNLHGFRPPRFGKSQHGSDAFIVYSRDKGRTWHPDLPEWTRRLHGPMFPGWKFGGPAFVQFGRDNRGAPDNFVYAVSGDQWDNGTDLRVGRVRKTAVLDAKAWEFVCGFRRGGGPVWKKDLESAVPVLSLKRQLSLPEMVYLAGLKRYLLLTWHLHEDYRCRGSGLTILESPHPWGPFSLVHREPLWDSPEVTPYNPRLPLKWFDPESNEGWLLHSGAWGNVKHYRMHVRRFRLKT